MSQRLRVAVVSGGPSNEAAVSRVSARGVVQALRARGHDTTGLELDAHLAESLRTGGFDGVFPVAHGAVGEDGCLQGLLEILGVPYVGSGVLASALAMDKSAARRVFADQSLPLAPGLTLPRGDALAAAQTARRTLGLRLVVKPSCSGSALGVTRIEAEAPDDRVALALEAAWAVGEVALAEHFAVGREVTCGVFDDGTGPRAFPPTEIASPHDAFYTFEARYAPNRSLHTCPASLPDGVAERVQSVAVSAHRALGCRDLSRADFVVGDLDDLRALFLLEVNTMPGFTATSLYPEAAKVAGVDFETLCDTLVRAAVRRGATRRNPPTAFPG